MSHASGGDFDSLLESMAPLDITGFLNDLLKDYGDSTLDILKRVKQCVDSVCTHPRHVVPDTGKVLEASSAFATFPCGHSFCVGCINRFDRANPRFNPVCSTCVSKLQGTMVSCCLPMLALYIQDGYCPQYNNLRLANSLAVEVLLFFRGVGGSTPSPEFFFFALVYVTVLAAGYQDGSG
jgi:hypothetical protein